VVTWSLAFLNAVTRELVYNANRSNSLFPADGTEAMTAPAPLLVSTFAALPSAASYPGGIAYASDSVGIAFSDGAAWHVLATSGGSVAWSTITGTPTTLSGYGITDAVFSIKVTTFSSNNTWTPDAKMRYALIEGWGGGGGGGGAAAGAIPFLGGGGAAGSKSEKTVSKATAGASQAVTIGPGGAGASAGNNAGTAGTDTSVGALMVAKGGGGGGGNPGTSTISSFALDGLGTGGGTGDLVGIGMVGEHAAGGSAVPVGSGARVIIATGTGNAGSGFASGGGGGFASAGVSGAGGAGTAGFVKITEYLFG